MRKIVPPVDAEVCVICPTRDRPDEFKELAESFVATSSGNAVLVAYVDDDQQDLYKDVFLHPKVKIYVDRQLGPVHSVNMVAHLYRDKCRIYGIAPDDSRFVVKGWDQYVVEVFEQMPGRLGILSASHNQGDYVNLPYVSREWIEVVGWFAYPAAYHFCWDSILEIIGEATHIVYSDPARFKMDHRYLLAANKGEHYASDATSFLLFCVNERRAIVQRLRKAIEEAHGSAETAGSLRS